MCFLFTLKDDMGGQGHCSTSCIDDVTPQPLKVSVSCASGCQVEQSESVEGGRANFRSYKGQTSCFTHSTSPRYSRRGSDCLSNRKKVPLARV